MQPLLPRLDPSRTQRWCTPQCGDCARGRTVHAFRMISGMFDHVTIRVSNRAASERFYETVLRTLEIGDPQGRPFAEWNDFSPRAASRNLGDAAAPRRLRGAARGARRRVLGGPERSRATRATVSRAPPAVQRLLRRLPPRSGWNSVEAVHHGSPGTAATSTTLIRVSDVEAATRIYETVGPAAGFRVGTELARPDAVRLHQRLVLAVVAGAGPSENVHLAFAAADDETVDRFHRDATAAGYRDNGAPASAGLPRGGATRPSCSTRTGTTSRW